MIRSFGSLVGIVPRRAVLVHATKRDVHITISTPLPLCRSVMYSTISCIQDADVATEVDSRINVVSDSQPDVDLRDPDRQFERMSPT